MNTYDDEVYRNARSPVGFAVAILCSTMFSVGCFYLLARTFA